MPVKPKTDRYHTVTPSLAVSPDELQRRAKEFSARQGQS